MKKLFLSLFILFLFMPFSFSMGNISFADSSSIYAKIEQSGIYLYSAPRSENSLRLFEIPNSYFVRLIESANDNFYYCVYKDVYGYVKKTEVTAMDGTPTQPFVEANFRVFATEGLGLYSSPSLNEENKKCVIPYLTDNVTYYGTILGQEAIPDKSSIWIYCKYSYDASNYGFVYSVFCDKLPTIATNNERFEIIKDPFFKSQSAKELTSVAMGFIIVGVSIPCLIVLYLLIRPTIAKEKVTSPKTKFKRAKNKDYFEFDEGDLN